MPDRLKSEPAYRRMVEETSDILWEINEKGAYVYCSPNVKEILGYEARELIGKTPFDHMPSEEAQRSIAVFWEVAKQAKPFSLWAHQMRRPEGDLLWVECSGRPVCDDTGRLKGYRGVTRDISARIERERREREEDERLFRTRQLEALGRLAGGVAHQLNNSLTGILGLSGVLMKDLGAGHPNAQDVEGVMAAARRAAGLVDQLMTFGRRQRGEKRLLNLNDAIGRVKEILSASVGERVDLRLDLEQGLPGVLVDGGQLEQLLMNLCLNARDAMDGSGTLTLKTEDLVLEKSRPCLHSDLKPGRYATLSVSDTGRGVAESDKPRLFEPFFTTKRFGEASGMGLAIVYAIVREAGGAVDFDSAAQRGTTFTLYFPAAARPAAPPSRALPGLSRGRETVLVADDDKAPREVLVRLLTSLGYTVLAAADGEEAVRLFRENRESVALVLLDIVMPGLRGDEVYEKLRAEKPGLKAIFMSGYATLQAMEQVRSSGLPFIAKPYAIEDMADAVRRALDGRTA